MIKRVFPLLTLAVMALGLLGACGGGGSETKNEADNLPFVGKWRKPGGSFSLDVTRDGLAFFDDDDMNPIGVITKYSLESPDKPDRLLFEYDEQHSGTVVYDRKKQTAKVTIKGFNDDGSDFEMTFDPADRLDRITIHMNADYKKVYSLEDNSPIDTLWLGETVKWIDDTLNRRRVLLDDGRRGYVMRENTYPVKGTPTDLALEETYRYRRSQFIDYYSFEKKDDKVIAHFRHEPKEAGEAVVDRYYLGDLDGFKIKVDKEFASAADASEWKTSAVSPIEKPFTISVLETDEYPFIVADGISYTMVEQR